MEEQDRVQGPTEGQDRRGPTEEQRKHGPTVRVIMGTPVSRRNSEIRIDTDLLQTKKDDTRRADIRRCQQEHLEAEEAETCLVLDCPFDTMECSKVATNWLLAHRGDEQLMHELADDPTFGRNPREITSLVTTDIDWFRIVRAIPELRDIAFSHLRGFALVTNREEVVRLAMETGTPVAFDSLLRMLRLTGLEIPAGLRKELKDQLITCGTDLSLWEGLLEDEEPDGHDLSPAMLVAYERAHQVAALHHVDWDQVEYWLVGILRVVEDRVPPFDRYLFNDQMDRDFKRDTEAVRITLAAYGLDLALFKVELRDTLRNTRGTGRSKRRQYWAEAEELAQRRGESGVWAGDVLELCLRHPSKPVQQAIAEYQAKHG